MKPKNLEPSQSLMTGFEDQTTMTLMYVVAAILNRFCYIHYVNYSAQEFEIDLMNTYELNALYYAMKLAKAFFLMTLGIYSEKSER